MTRALACLVLFAACGSKSPSPAKPAEPPPATGSALAAGSAESATGSAAQPAPDPEKIKADAVAAENAAYEKAKPVFEKYCAACHKQGSKKANAKRLKHFDMTTYPFGGEHSASIGNEIRKVLAIDGDKATMPDDKRGAVKGDDLEAIKAWSEAWRAAGEAGAHPAEPADND